jgi:tripartite-type tricarboxylate transporter receptor subunit TctC
VVPVASAIDSTLALTVSEAAKVNTLAEFVALAKAQPGKLNWAATTGLPLYVVAALQKVAGIDITQISYRDFSPAFQDFSSGRVQLLATGITLLLPQVQAGRGKFLMVTNSVRSPLALEVPTPQEAGFPELTFNGVNGIYGWRDMPASLKARIAADVREIATDPTVAARLQPTGATPRPGNAAEFAAAIEEQRAKVAAVAQAAGVTK